MGSSEARLIQLRTKLSSVVQSFASQIITAENAANALRTLEISYYGTATPLASIADVNISGRIAKKITCADRTAKSEVFAQLRESYGNRFEQSDDSFVCDTWGDFIRSHDENNRRLAARAEEMIFEIAGESIANYNNSDLELFEHHAIKCRNIAINSIADLLSGGKPWRLDFADDL